MYRASDYYLTKLCYRDFKTVALGNSGESPLASPEIMLFPLFLIPDHSESGIFGFVEEGLEEYGPHHILVNHYD